MTLSKRPFSSSDITGGAAGAASRGAAGCDPALDGGSSLGDPAPSGRVTSAMRSESIHVCLGETTVEID